MRLSEVNIADLSPAMRQYVEIKNKYKKHILFFRLGDFYEMFFDDAITVSRELEITLTGKDCGLTERAPMCEKEMLQRYFSSCFMRLCIPF